jgi:hypothetical protein
MAVVYLGRFRRSVVVDRRFDRTNESGEFATDCGSQTLAAQTFWFRRSPAAALSRRWLAAAEPGLSSWPLLPRNGSLRARDAMTPRCTIVAARDRHNARSRRAAIQFQLSEGFWPSNLPLFHVSAGVILTHVVGVKMTHLGEDGGILAADDADPEAGSGDQGTCPSRCGDTGNRKAAGCSRNTVKRYLSDANAVRYGPRSPQPTKLDPFTRWRPP